MIEVKKLSFTYNSYEIEILKDISFEIKRGDIVGIAGPNGSGKSTLTKILSGYLKGYSGNVLIQGEDIKAIERKAFSKRLSVLQQEVEIFFPYRIKEVVLMGRYPHLKRFGSYSKHDFEVVAEVLKYTDMDSCKDKNIKMLSGGEKQRAFIAKALAAEAEILILDEPTSNLDIRHQLEITNILKKLNKEKNLTIVIISHDINLISTFCNKIMLLNKGELVAYGNTEDVLTADNLEKVYEVGFYLERGNNGKLWIGVKN